MNGIETVLVAMLAGALRVSTPFLFVSLGECLTERAGRINLGNEGVLVLGAMVAYATSYLTGSPWLGVLAAGITGAGAWFAGMPFLTSAYGYVHLWGVDPVEWATAMGFDTGVFLAVVGAVMLALNSLSRIARAAGQETAPSDTPRKGSR